MNKLVVITGITSGIGLALKERYLRDGYEVVGLSLDCKDENANNYKCDVSNEEEVASVFEKIKSNYSKIDVLINCAGYATFGATELISNQSAKKLFDVNYFGTLNVIKSAMGLMGKGSRIVNISSACSFFAVPYRTHYSATKAAVSMLSYGLKMELKDSGIDVVCVCPGDIKTNFCKNREKLFETNERYGNKIEESAKQIEEKEYKRMTVDFATDKIYKAITKKKCKPMYVIGGKTKFLYFMSRILPLSVVIWYTNKKY